MQIARLRRLFPAMWVTIAIMSHPVDVFALAEEYLTNSPLPAANFVQWPGVLPLVNHPDRVYGTWVNGHEDLLYRSEIKALNLALREFSELTQAGREVVLAIGPHHRKPFRQDHEIRGNWSLSLYGGIARHMTTLDQGNKVWNPDPVMTVYVDASTPLEKLIIPEGLLVLGPTELSARITKGIEISQDKTVRGWGCGRLTAIDSTSRANAMVVGRLLSDSDEWVRTNAILNIGRFGNLASSYVHELRQLQLTESERNQPAIMTALDEIKEAGPDDEVQKARQDAIAEISAFVARHQAKRSKP